MPVDVGQSIHALDAAHVEKNSSCREIEVALEKCSQLGGQLHVQQNVLQNTRTSGGTPSRKIELLRAVFHVWPFQPCPCLFPCRSLDFRVCDNFPVLCGRDMLFAPG